MEQPQEAAPELVETILVQYRDFESDHECGDPSAAAELLLEWLADPERSPHFNVRVWRRYQRKNEVRK